MKQVINSFKDLNWLIGQEVEILGGIDYYWYPEKTEIIAEYPRTVMLEMTFIRSDYGLKLAPRKVKLLIDKGAILCGRVKLRLKESRLMLTADDIGNMIYVEG